MSSSSFSIVPSNLSMHLHHLICNRTLPECRGPTYMPFLVKMSIVLAVNAEVCQIAHPNLDL